MGVWIDTDMGFDDIAAIMVVAASSQKIDGVSLVFGNAPLDWVKRNAASAALAFDWAFPIHSGRARPVMGRLETAQNILGLSGIPTLGQTLPEAAPLPESCAFRALCAWLETAGAPRRILALGPLTNIASLVLARPDLAARIDELVWMGGGVGKGNHTASAEFNAFADPEAAAIVFAHDLPVKMVDLDFCRQVLAAPTDAQELRRQGGKNAALLADLFGGFIAIATARGRAEMALYDPAAAIAFVRPDLVHFQSAAISVECSGNLTRGRTVVETRESHADFNAEFAQSGNFPAIKALILAALRVESAR